MALEEDGVLSFEKAPHLASHPLLSLVVVASPGGESNMGVVAFTTRTGSDGKGEEWFARPGKAPCKTPPTSRAVGHS